MGIFDIFKKKNNPSTELPNEIKTSHTVVPEPVSTPEVTPEPAPTPIEAVAPEVTSEVAPEVTPAPEAAPVTEQPQATATPAETNEAAAPTEEKYYGDLEKTAIIHQLTSVPVENRTQDWMMALTHHIPNASFRCGEPQVIQGPDGYPYFGLYIPEPGKEFECFVIDKMKDDFLLSQGLGIVLHPDKENPDVVFTYGDVVNYHLNGHFFYNDNSFGAGEKTETIQEDEEVMVGNPDEKTVPTVTRNVLRQFFASNGVTNPKIMMMLRKKGEKMYRDVVFNITPEMFENQDHFNAVMQAVGWFLPRHYTYLSIDEATIEDNAFTDL